MTIGELHEKLDEELAKMPPWEPTEEQKEEIKQFQEKYIRKHLDEWLSLSNEMNSTYRISKILTKEGLNILTLLLNKIASASLDNRVLVFDVPSCAVKFEY